MKTHLILPRSLALCVITLFAAAQPGGAATISVNSVSDVQANDGVCTLREAIENANGDNQSGSTDCAAGSGADEINITVAGEILLMGPLPILSTDMTIIGVGAGSTFVTGPIGRTGLGSFRCFNKTAGTATIANMTLRKGVSPAGTGITDGVGGAIVNFGPLTLVGVVVTQNQSRSATQPDGSTGISVGAGIASAGPLTILSSTFGQNAAIGGDHATTGKGGYGGAIFIEQGFPLTIANSNIGGTAADANLAQGGNGGTTSGEAFGGGIFANGAGAITITNSNIGFNTAASPPAPVSRNVGGGGIFVQGATNPVTIQSNTQVSNNFAISGNSTASGASATVGNVSGGGILSNNPLTISDSTINSNQANAGSVSNGTAARVSGGGITATSALTLTNTEIGFNTITPGDGGGSPDVNGAGIVWAAPSGSVFNVTGSTIKNNVINTHTGTGTNSHFQHGGGISVFAGSSGSTTFSMSDSVVTSNTVRGATTSRSSNFGGGIFAQGPVAVTINNTLISGNSVQATTGPTSQSLGGGIFHGASIPMSINGSDIMGNSVASTEQTFNHGGGGIGIAFGSRTISITDSTIAGNNAPTGGGIGVAVGGGTINLLRSTVSGNTASAAGGGILDDTGNTINLSSSTISGNSVTASGSAFTSGGIDTSGTLQATNSTFSGNLNPNCTGGCGGGIWTRGTVTLTNSTFTNHPQSGTTNAGAIYSFNGTVNVKNTILAANAGNMSADVRRNPGATTGMGFVSQGHNLIGDVGAVTAFTQTGDQTGTSAAPLNPMLGALTNNGGSTLTHLPLAGSPVIDKGAAATDPITSTAITTDQRGSARLDDPAIPNAPGGNGSEIGAVESSALVVLIVTKTADTDDAVCDADCSLREALSVADGDANLNTIIFNIPANSPGCVGTDCTITLGSTLFPTSDSGLLTTINGFTGSNRITVSGNNAVRILNVDNGANLSIDGVNFTAGNSTTAAGIYINNGRLTLTNCALFNNNNPNSPGGAIRCDTNCVLNLTNVTISNNTAVGGNGVFNSGTVTAKNCTIANNSGGFVSGGIGNGGSFTIGNSIVAGNSAAIGPDANGTFMSLGHNLIGNGNNATGFTAAGDQVGVNPQLLPLANNGGPTRTCALQSGSPAINAGDDLLAPVTDQRGFIRSGFSDIGAYEFNGTAPAFNLTNARSRKAHGPAGTFDLSLPLTGNPGVESRSGGATSDYTVIFTFSNYLSSVGGASVTSGSGSVASGAFGSDRHEYVVNLTGVANAQNLTLTLSNVIDAFGANTSAVPVTMRFLLGDTTGNGSVTASDIGQVKSQSGQPVGAANFRNDVNANGAINASDIGQVKAQSGTTVP